MSKYLLYTVDGNKNSSFMLKDNLTLFNWNNNRNGYYIDSTPVYLGKRVWIKNMLKHLIDLLEKI